MDAIHNLFRTLPAAVTLYLAGALAPCFGSLRYFASGSNRAGEIRGLSLSGCDFGVVAPEMMRARGIEARPAMAELVAAADTGVSVFVDSGAFSEVEFTKTGPTWPKPMNHTDWRRVFACYATAAQAFGARAYLVAPDRVACQSTTLARQERYASQVRELATTGANILVPVQKGAAPMADFYAAELATLRIPAAQVVASIPMKKDATTLDELVEFVTAVQPPRLHLLGMGPKNRKYAATIAAIAAASPSTEVMCDSVLMAAIAGRKEGRKVTGGRRPLTVAMDLVAMARLDLKNNTERRAFAIQALANLARPVAAEAAATEAG